MKNLQKTMQVIILLILTGTLLVSCEKQNAPLATKTGTTGALAATGTTQLPVPAIKRNNRPIKPVTSSGTSVIAAQKKMMDQIQNVTTLADLAAFSSGILNNPKKDHPKFVELQKKQMILGMIQSQIQSPEYKELQKLTSAIYEVKELWTPEIQALDVKIQGVIKNFSTNTGSQVGIGDEFKKLMDQKNALIQEIHTSKEFQEYMQKNQSKLDSLKEDEKKYWTPEMTSLQQEITTLSKEVYGIPSAK